MQFLCVCINYSVSLQRYGVTKRHLSLRSEDCHARENATHFILETALTSCGTVQHPDPRTLVYENVVSWHACVCERVKLVP